jgi:non-ribosomal peptide synthase protein (TIGR01720 family)
MSIPTVSTSTNGSEIAIIGLAGRFPGAKNIDEFWNNLQNGVESIYFFSEEELLESGIDAEVLSYSNYVKANAVIEGVELFDASFFGFNPREAEITDPQHRIFLESAWEALEDAGYKSGIEKFPIGVFAGASLNNYLLNVYSNQKIISVDEQQLTIGCDKDFLSTRTSYKLNLTGPSYTVQTACSTSLVAVHLACQSLLNGECDIALAGGVAVNSERKSGYLYTEGGILSPDGHCRAFDANAQGTVGGEGVGIVVLKRLEDALNDRDTIHAVIKGSAINNDGSLKVSYTAPRIDTQAKAIRTAQLVAEIEPETVTYIEAHGTGTALGDPIEVAALTQAFRTSTQKKDFCAIGSVKTNIGHLDTAAGVAGLIKTVLALKHKQIPPSLHYSSPNPEIDFANSPFYVNTKLAEWQSNGTPRRAGVSSFGIGGTNAHVVLEEAPLVETQDITSLHSRPCQLLMLSAKTSSALETATTNLVNYFQKHSDLNLADAAYTLQVGRRAFDYRRAVVCRDIQDAVNALQDPRRVITNAQKTQQRPVAFMFSGLGTHYIDMALELYQTEPTFRVCVDQCCELLKPQLGLDLQDVLYPNRNSKNSNKQKQNAPSTGLDLRKMLGRGEEPADGETLHATSLLNQTVLTQPAIFVVEYALAQLWMSRGIRPASMIGYSVGEYVAATLAEVLSLEDALTLVARRAQMIEELPEGVMLAVPLSEEEIQPLLNEKISLSAINGSSLCVIAGVTDAVEEWERQLSEQNLVGKRLQTSHAFHSVMMEAIAPTFGDLVKTFSLKPPKIPYISNVTGTWITAEQATDPSYWVKHLCKTVRFASGVQQLWQKDNPILLEVGPGQALISFASQCLESDDKAKSVMLPTLRHSYEQQSDVAFLMNTLGRLWLAGVEIDWSGFYANEQRNRIPLPTYPFEHQRYWIGVNSEANLAQRAPQALHKKPDIADWFYIPSWKRSPHLPSKSSQKLRCLVFIDALGVGSQLAEKLELQGHDIITVAIGEQFTKLGDRVYAINPQTSSDYDSLLQELSILNLNPNAIAHFWSVTANDTLPSNQSLEQPESSHQFLEDTQNCGFWSLLFLAQALGRRNINDALKLIVVTSNVHDITGEDSLCPEKATILGACKVIPQEYPKISCCNIDIVISSCENPPVQKLLDSLVTEITSQRTDDIVAYRGYHRWVQTFESVRLDRDIASKTKLREGGVYLITGGLGGIGLVLAENLAQTAQAKLILVGRKGLPERSQWEQWLATHDNRDSVSRKIEKVLALEKLGAIVQVHSADVANIEQMQAVVAQTLKQFGRIDGVIHAAGIAPGGIIQLKTKEMANKVLAAKVRGTLVLNEVLKNSNLDFFVLCSSQTSVLGHFGQLDYCAANAFLDTYAHYCACKSSQLTISISWGPWQVGMEVETVVADEIKQMREEANLKLGIKPQEGIDAFHRILESNLPHIVVSTQDFLALIEQNKSSQVEEELAILEEKLVSANITVPNHPRPNLENGYVAPRNEVEENLAKIWRQRLGIDEVGIYDNFFELGGDSVLAIQVIAKANKLGLKLTAQQMFQHQTIAELAIAAYMPKTKQTENSLQAGEVYLTPIQHRFFAQNQPDVHSFNQSLLLEIRQICDPKVLEQAVKYVIQYHDAFRLRFTQRESGWQQIEANTNDLDIVVHQYVNSSLLSETEQKRALESTIKKIQSDFNLSKDSLVKVAFIELQKTSYLLITIHQLLVDGISWQILLEDFQTAYQQLNQAKAIHLPDKTTSFKKWAQCMQDYAESSEVMREHDYWLAKAQKPFRILPVDYLTRENTEVNFNILSISLDKKPTQALLRNVNKAYNTQISDVLLTALVQAFVKWTGDLQLWVDVEDNSREKIFKSISDISLSRTVGLFTTCFPANLDITEASDQGSALVAVKDYLRSIPNQGAGYDVLRYTSSNQEVKSTLASFPQPQVSFKYLGNFDPLISQSSLFNLPQKHFKLNQRLGTNRFYLLEINGVIVQEQLQLNWIYSTAVHRRETIETLALNYIDALQSIIAHCQSLEGRKYTPSDFPRANLSQQNLDKLLAKINQANEEAVQ